MKTIAESITHEPSYDLSERALGHSIPTVGMSVLGAATRKPGTAGRSIPAVATAAVYEPDSTRGSDLGTTHRVSVKIIPTVGMRDAPKQVNACVQYQIR